MLIISYLPAVSGFSSTLSFPIFIFPLNSSAISLSIGPIIWQGLHHGAQKSTSTGAELDLIISFSKFWSVKIISLIFFILNNYSKIILYPAFLVKQKNQRRPTFPAKPVSSAQAGLTSVFGMGTGIPPPLKPLVKKSF